MAGSLRNIATTIRVVPAADRRLKRLFQLGGLVLNRSSIIWRYSSHTAAVALRQMLASGAYDAVFFEGIMVAGHAQSAQSAGLRVIVDEHNLEWELLMRSAQQAPTRLRRLQYQRESEALRRVELSTLERADLVVVTSERERAILRTLLPHARVCVAPNGVDVAAFAPDPSRAEIPGRIVFTASMDYHPNEQGAHFFVERCLPTILQRRPDTTLFLVGANPPASFGRFAHHPNITVTGAVPETRSYLAEAQVALAPLQVGGGTRLKILEALAMGKAVVSTTLGYEGIDLTPGLHLLAADTPEAFAAAVIRALDDSDLRARLGTAGREVVVRRYSWECSSEALRTALGQLPSPREVAHVALADR